MRRATRLLAAAVIAAGVCLAGTASHAAGATSGEVLRTDFTARSSAMGGHMPAGANGVEAAWYNPAGLSRGTRSEVALGYNALTLDINQGSLGYAGRAGEKGGWGLYLNYLDYGKQNRTTVTNAGGVVTVNRAGQFEAHDLVAGIAYGRRIAERLRLGVAGKVIHSKLDNATATAFAADLGAEYELAAFPLTAGVAVRNLGTELKYDRVKEDLPLTVDFGVSLRLLNDRVRLNLGGEKPRDLDAAFRGGLEARPLAALPLWLRAGYAGGRKVDDGWSVGLGFAVDSLALDYAYQPFGPFGDRHRVGIRFSWE